MVKKVVTSYKVKKKKDEKHVSKMIRTRASRTRDVDKIDRLFYYYIFIQ